VLLQQNLEFGLFNSFLIAQQLAFHQEFFKLAAGDISPVLYQAHTVKEVSKQTKICRCCCLREYFCIAEPILKSSPFCPTHFRNLNSACQR